jgi:CBS domain-containing protein
MEARDVMTSSVITVAPDTPVAEIAALMLERRISAVPVVDATGRLQGIVSEGDLMRHARAGTGRSGSWWLALFADRDETAQDYVKSHGLTATDVMTSRVVTAAENAPIDRIASLLERHRIKRVPIVRRGKVVGIVSRANLLHGLVARTAPAPRSVIKDREIRARLLATLGEAGVARSFINVVVTSGTVELWGWVESEAQKRALAIAAKETAGVKRVVDNVNVMTPAIRSAMSR